MLETEWKYLLNPGLANRSELFSVTDVAVAEIGLDGTITALNEYGQTCWEVRKGEKIPADVYLALQEVSSLVLPVELGGLQLIGAGSETIDGWLLIGFQHDDESATRAESSFKTLLEKNPTPVLRLDEMGIVVDANSMACELLGVDREDLIGECYLQQHVHPEDKSLLQHVFHQALAGAAQQCAIRLKTSFVRIAELSLFPVRMNGSVELECIIFANEGDGLADSVELAPNSLDQLKSVFIATMSHEIRSPLGAVNGYAELLHRELQEFQDKSEILLPDQVNEFVGAIRDNSKRILNLANELFDLANMQDLKLSQVALHRLLIPLIKGVTEALKEKGVTFEVELNPKDILLMGHKKRLAQVLENLFSNAVKFTNKGKVILRTRVEGQHAVIEIADTGIGISQEYLNMLFTPFSQEHHGINRRFAGTGLGLPLSKLLIDLMQGHIEVESTKGEGSRFCLYLPLAY